MVKQLAKSLWKVELVSNWRKLNTWVSTWCFYLIGSIQTTYLLLPETMKAVIPPKALMGATIALGVLGVVGRITKPKGAKDETS